MPSSLARPFLAAGARPRPIVPASMAEAMELARAVVAARLAPRGLDTPEACMIAILHGLEVGLTPLAALQRIAVIDGRPTIWGDGALALVRASGLLRSIDESLRGQETDLTATCTVERRGDLGPLTRCFGADDARRAGLWGRPGPWRDYPGRMLQMRARAFALRDAFPDVLGGLYLREEVEEPPRAPVPPDPSGMPQDRGLPGPASHGARAGGGEAQIRLDLQDRVAPSDEPEAAEARARTAQSPSRPDRNAPGEVAYEPVPTPSHQPKAEPHAAQAASSASARDRHGGAQAEAGRGSGCAHPAEPDPDEAGFHRDDGATAGREGSPPAADVNRRPRTAARRALPNVRRAAAVRRTAGWQQLGQVAHAVAGGLAPGRAQKRSPGARGRKRPSRVKEQQPPHERAAAPACTLPSQVEPVRSAPTPSSVPPALREPLVRSEMPADPTKRRWSPPRDSLADFDLALCCAHDHQTLQEIEDEFTLALERLSSDERKQAELILSRHRARVTRLDKGELA